MKYFVYGILRNHERWGLRLLSPNVALKGFKMYTQSGAYPFVIFTGNKADVVYGDVVEFTSEETRDEVDAMEAGAGYHTETLNPEDYRDEPLNNGVIKIYLFPQNTETGSEFVKEITTGDWFDYRPKIS